MNTALPHSWSELTWQQLCDCWMVKMRYGGNPDVARYTALLTLLGCSVCRRTTAAYTATTGEALYHIVDSNGMVYVVTPRELSQLAAQALPWFDYPYGDSGETVVKDEKGKVTKEARDPVRGYVSNMRDALKLPEEQVTVDGIIFALPQLACNNITWQQYRSLQAIVAQLFAEGVTEEQVLDLQAQFLAHSLVPAKDAAPSTDKFQPSHTFVYNTERAEQTVAFWRERLAGAARDNDITKPRHNDKGTAPVPVLFHICFQTYQTALTYYAQAYPLLFSGGDKSDPMRDALQGEVGTINSIMKYQGYNEPQQVYDTNLPIIFDTLNTMTKEAKEIEKMNAKIKKK